MKSKSLAQTIKQLRVQRSAYENCRGLPVILELLPKQGRLLVPDSHMNACSPTIIEINMLEKGHGGRFAKVWSLDTEDLADNISKEKHQFEKRFGVGVKTDVLQLSPIGKPELMPRCSDHVSFISWNHLEVAQRVAKVGGDGQQCQCSSIPVVHEQNVCIPLR
ncbi:unnamed protein product [Cochlearia groenlandica]